MRTYHLANLHCRETHTTCRAKHEQRLSLLEFRPVLERVMRCPIRHHKGGRSGEIHTARHRDQPKCISDNFLSKTTQSSECNHPVTYLDVIYTLSNLFDDASNLTAWYKGKWRLRLVSSLDDQCIREIYTTRLHANNHLTFPRFEWFDIFDHKALWRPECLT